MGANLDKAKGKIKEEVGSKTGDRNLEADGKLDQAAGAAKSAGAKLKDAAGTVKDKVADLADDAKR